jgi:hypothetical protein
MTIHVKGLFIFLSVLCSTAASTNHCENEGACSVDDETSLMQVNHAVVSGRERGATDSLVETGEVVEEDLDEKDEKKIDSEIDSEVAEEDWPTSVTPVPAFTAMPADCTGQRLCIGSAPWCGGDKGDCHKYGMTVIGWQRRCMGSFWTCLSGWKVICAKCTTSVDVLMPNALPLVSRWTAPPPAPQVVAPPPAVTSVSIPKFVLPSFVYHYEHGAINNTKLAFDSAWKNLTGFKASVCNQTKVLKEIGKNITKYKREERRYKESAQRSRVAAVKYAKKGFLSNVTLMKAARAMDDALTAESGATNKALEYTATETNARLHKVFYKKHLIDEREKLKEAEEALRVAKIAVNTAASNYRHMKKLRHEHEAHLKSGKWKRRARAHDNVRLAEDLAVKKSMEEAYAKASPTFGLAEDQKRDINNVPPSGKYDWGV